MELELLLGLWLLAGVYPRLARVAGLACFAAFLGVSVSQALAGEASCGCFGDVPVNPWVTVVLDCLAVAALWAWRPVEARWGTIRGKPAWAVGLASVALVVLSAGAVTTVLDRPAELAEDGEIIGGGHVVVLEPEKWVGKRLPLLKHIDIGPELEFGQWTVVLYRRDCPLCQQELPKYRHLVQEMASIANAPRVALVEVQPFGESDQRIGEESLRCLTGRLLSNREWHVKVPVTLWLRGGRVVTAQGAG